MVAPPPPVRKGPSRPSPQKPLARMRPGGILLVRGMEKKTRSRWLSAILPGAAAAVVTAAIAGRKWISAWLRPSFDQIDEGLFLGGGVAVPPPGTHAVLNVCRDADCYEAPIHRWEPIRDGGPAPSLEWLRRQVEFVSAQVREGRPVYVHCRAGVSRSGMVVLAYQMARHGWTLEQALEHVRTHRKVVRPNRHFRKLLKEWEKAVAPTARPPAALAAPACGR